MRAVQVLLIIVLTACMAHAAPKEASYDTDSKSRDAELAAYSRAAGLEPLAAVGGDEFRVWGYDYMLGNLSGTIVSAEHTLRCKTKYSYSGGVITVRPAKCRSVHVWPKKQEALAALADLSKLDQTEFSCEVQDGGGFTIEGRASGRKFSFRAGNPGFCDTEWSRVVNRALDLLP